MKFRWKLLILLLVISIIPIVTLRTFGINNVRLMIKALVSQFEAKQINDVRHRFQLVIKEYSKLISKSRERAEMALFYQIFEVTRIFQTEISEHNQRKPSLKPDPGVPISNEIINHPYDVPVESGKNGDEMAFGENEPCFRVAPTVDAAHVKWDILRLKRMTPLYQAVSQYLGNLVLRQYFGLENGGGIVYPCDDDIQHTAGADNQFWYQSAFQEKATAWSRPYVDPISGQTVMALSYPVLTEDQHAIGVASLLVSLRSLLEEAFLIPELPAGSRNYLCTLALRPSDGIAGAKILASAQQSESLSSAQEPKQPPHWLASSDKEQFRAMLEDIARRQYRIREMPFAGRMSFWAYGPLMHQGTAFVFIVPKEQVLNLENNPILESIQRRLKKTQNYSAGFLILLILLASVIAFAFSRTVSKHLAKLSAAAQKLSEGDFEAGVSITSRDEFGNIGDIFNSIGPQLKEHYRMRRSLEIAQEIQRNLLPESPLQLPGLDIYGMTLFSEKTGGDYFDYLCVDKAQKEKLCITVGDVSDHGIPAAILMATARGLLRLRAIIPGTLSEIVSDINREFCKDVGDSGRFMTMFLARVDRSRNRVDWIRAGHDPGMLYDPDTDSFSSLDEGRGLPLGVDEETIYKSSSCSIKPGQIIFLGTDGISEARNADGNLFGKNRLQEVIRANSRESARKVALSVLDAVEEFRGKGEQEDDLTLVIIKIIDI